jgi:predicted AAA+ superfamily ATPase
MRIDHTIAIKMKKASIKTDWIKHYHSGVSIKNPFKKDGRGGLKPSSYHKLFIAFLTHSMGEGVSGKTLRTECGWREGTHSDYFSLFTQNDIIKYDRSKKKYFASTNFTAYFEFAKSRYEEMGGK